MKSVLYLGCPTEERADTERLLAAAYESRNSGQPVEIASHPLYGQAPSMREVMALIARAATKRAGVILRGEEATGRQVAARAIHDAQISSSEPKGAFVCVDCEVDEVDPIAADLTHDAGEQTVRIELAIGQIAEVPIREIAGIATRPRSEQDQQAQTRRTRLSLHTLAGGRIQSQAFGGRMPSAPPEIVTCTNVHAASREGPLLPNEIQMGGVAQGSHRQARRAILISINLIR